MTTTNKVCFLYSGQARSIKQVWANHVFHLHRKFTNADIFVSVEDEPNADDMLTLRDGCPNSGWFMEKVVQPDIPDPTPRCSWHSGYPPSTTPLGILRQLWALNRCWEFFTEKAQPDDYTAIFRVRPDSVFYRLELPFYPANTAFCLTPWHSRWGGINDRFAMMGPVAARFYFTCFHRRQALWDAFCPLHPETMMMENLRQNGIEPDDSLSAEFGTLRPNGQLVGCEPSIVDVADYARHKR